VSGIILCIVDPVCGRTSSSIKVKANHPEPINWTPFVLYGEMNPGNVYGESLGRIQGQAALFADIGATEPSRIAARTSPLRRGSTSVVGDAGSCRLMIEGSQSSQLN